ncbi:helix-turn-helix domain-containing protein [Streptomyces sp. NBC_00887]|uniref:helix-turn-helix domain-containing protein n=1 Tax=Streptomyces sp. NBC_00887 TaxID=2975859 RepID=UPI00386F037B
MRLRRADGLTQEEVARALGVSRVAFLRWENGQVVPRAQHLAAYSRLLTGLAAKHPEVGQEADVVSSPRSTSSP